MLKRGEIWLSDISRSGSERRLLQMACKKCERGGTYRGATIKARRVRKRGGRGGECWAIEVASLPPELQARYRERLGGDEAAPTAAVGDAAALPTHAPPRAIHLNKDTEARIASFEKVACETRAGTAERKQLIAAEAAALGLSATRYRQQFKLCQEEGVAAAARKARSDQRKRRVCLSRDWDACAERMGLTAEAKAAIVQETERRIASEWRSGGPKQPCSNVQAKVMGWLVKRCKEAAAATVDAVSDAELRKACTLPKALIRRTDFKKNQAVAIAERDAGRANAKQVGRIRRDWSHLQPMAMVSADVHPSDTLVLREDGSQATARVVAWLDQATGRQFVTAYLLKKGEGLKSSHVVESFAALCADPSWGVPTGIYADNGSEYNSWSELFEPLAQLKVAIHGDGSIRPGLTHARAYQPQSKAIEHGFAIIERILADMPGHIGSNRMNKKCERQGEPIASITFAQFQEQLAVAIAFYNNREQPRSLTLKGKSPNEAFRAHIEAGWQSHTMTKEELVAYFCKPIGKKNGTRLVQAGGKFTVSGVPYYADELQTFVGGGHRVLLKRPLLGDQSRLLAYAEDTGELLCIADPERTYRHDAEGLAEAARREKAGREGLRAMKKDTNKLDQVESYRAANEAYGAPPVGKALNVVPLNPKARKVQQALQAPRARPAADPVTSVPEDDRALRDQEEKEFDAAMARYLEVREKKRSQSQP